MNRIRRRKIYSAFNLVLLAILGIAAAIGIMYFFQYFEMLVVSLAVLIVFLFSIATISIIRSLRSVENESFDQGMFAVMESVPMVCSLYDKDNNIKYCNDEAPKLFGFSDKQKYSEHYNDSFPEFQPNGKRSEDMATEMIGKIMETGRSTLDWWQKTATGELIPLHLHCVGIFFRGEDHMLEFTKDKRQELEMQKKEEALKERMQLMLDSSPLLCVLFDENSNIVDVNREVVNLLGAPDRQTYINSPSAYRPEFQSGGIRSDEKSVQLLKEIAETGFARYEWNYMHQNGSLVPTEEILRRISIAGRDMLISYSRDLREHYASKEREEQIQKSIISMMNQLNNHVSEQSAAVAESAAAIEEMVANVHSVTLALTKNAEQVTALQAASGVGHSGLNEVAFDIRQIAEESEALLGINSIMQNIASKTNLLSMNAAIEAAHAGESGRGFSFVATEVRTLAESSGEQSKSIGGVLKRIKSSIDKVTKSIESVLGKFNTIDGGIKDVAEQERLVLDAMGEQQRGSEQMLEAINQLNEITHRVKTDSQDMAKRYQQSA